MIKNITFHHLAMQMRWLRPTITYSQPTKVYGDAILNGQMQCEY